MQKSGFFNANQTGDTYDRVYKAEDFAAYFASFISNGVFPNPSTGLQVLADSGRDVTVQSGQAWIYGYWYSNTEPLYFNIDAADGALNRIDVFVVRLTYSDRIMETRLVKGIPAVTPTEYIPVRNADMYELVLAKISIRKGTVNVNQADITDTRLDNNVCGLVHGVVDQVDTTTIFNQFQDYYDSKVAAWDKQMADQQTAWTAQTSKQQTDWNSQTSTQQSTWSTQTTKQQGDWTAQMQEQQSSYDLQEDRLEADFLAWFETIKGILDGDVAGKLLNKIMEHEANQEIHVNATYKERWNNVPLDASIVYDAPNDTYNLTLINPPEVMPDIVNVRWVSESYYEIGQMFKLNDKTYDTKYAAFEEGDVVTAQFYDGVAYFSSGGGGGPAPDVGIAKVVITSHDGQNLNRPISYTLTGGETKTAQVDDTGLLLLTLTPGVYTFNVTSVPSGYRTPAPVTVTVVAGRRAAVNMFMAYTAIDEDKTKVVIDVTTFDDQNKEGLVVKIGADVTVTTDATGHAEKLMPAYSAPDILAVYEIAITPNKGYKRPPNKTLTAVAMGEISAGFFLDEQLIEPDKTVITVNVATFDNQNKEGLTVTFGTETALTDASGKATITLDAYVDPLADPKVLKSYTVKVSAKQGYKSPAAQTVEAIPGEEITINAFLEEQIAPDGKCIFNVQVNTYDGQNKGGIHVIVNGTTYYTNVNGYVLVMVDVA